MSYDIWLEADLGGSETVEIAGLYWNYTSNCAPMWRAAGADLGAFDGKPAGECVHVLEKAIQEMRDNPAKYIAMNPDNGWGSYETVLPALVELVEAFWKAPKARVVVSR